MNLDTRVKDAGGIYKRYALPLEKLGISVFRDFLLHIPSRYDDFTLISKINEIQEGEVITIQGTVQTIKNEFTKSYKKLQKATVSDSTGEIDIIWFNQPYIPKIVNPGDTISLSGRVGRFIHKLTLESPEYEVISNGQPNLHTGRLVPIYPETRGLSSKWLRRQVYKLLSEHKEELDEYIPDSILKENNLMGFLEALEQIHFPTSIENADRARERLSFDELLSLQLAARIRKQEWEKSLTSNIFSVDTHKKKVEELWNSLPFTLTSAQQKAIHDIFQDLATEKPMNRLLEGDVGSGKTVVAAIAMYLAYLNGYQSVLMAPTEILANQHFKTISDLLSPLGITVGLATGSKKITTDSFHILVGTHAVLNEKINFGNLGFIVIDEQQRFGVKQRGIIRHKGKSPHLLTMTATPIPRTVALTMYGDLDVSYLDEMPKGRKKILTWLVPDKKRDPGYEWIRKEILDHNSQVFIICPFIEESESMTTIKAATVEFERLQKEVFPDLKLGMLHGRMKGKEKDKVLGEFREKNYHILVATPVVEVGIDISNATVIVIEAADRFGLSQLHQLRGRVGRGDKQSYCLLFSESPSELTQTRLKAMETMQVGAELAELDLKLRGPGDMYGTAQHGVPKLKVARFSDFSLIAKAKKESEKLFPNLQKYPKLMEKLQAITIQEVSPN